jgi:ribonuclease HII
MIVGIDEAGRGPLAGAVVGCALYLKRNPPFVPRDSKELSPLAREAMFNWLIENSTFSVAIATPEEIDRVNILEATFLTFNRAINGIIKKNLALENASFIVDGNIFRTNLNIRYTCIEKADKTVKEVSCASIIAKVTRDHLMGLIDFIYPQWNFYKHNGYPTREHREMLKLKSLTEFHRRSFAPCAAGRSCNISGQVDLHG